MIGRIAVGYIVVVRVDGIHVACLVDAHVYELVPVAHIPVRVVIHDLIGEGFASISGNSHVDNVGVAWASSRDCTTLHVTAIDSAEGLVDVVGGWIDHLVPDLVATDDIEEIEMVGINGIAQLCECRSRVEATIYVDIICRDIVVGDTHLGCPIGSNPFTVITRNGSANRIERPGVAFVCAGADINIRQRQTGDVNVVIADGVFNRRHRQISVTTTWCKSATVRAGACVRRWKCRVVQAVVGCIRSPGICACAQTILRRGIEVSF